MEGEGRTFHEVHHELGREFDEREGEESLVLAVRGRREGGREGGRGE